jgi:hypothetical protein
MSAYPSQKQERKSDQMLSFHPVSKARANKCHICRQCKYIVYIQYDSDHGDTLVV